MCFAGQLMTKTNPCLRYKESLVCHAIGAHPCSNFTKSTLLQALIADAWLWGCSLIVGLQSWSSALQNPSVLHDVVPKSPQGLCGCAQPGLHPQNTWVFSLLTLIHKTCQGQIRFWKDTEKSTEWKRPLACYSQNVSVTWIWKMV